ncbi:aldehyde dehydrogenase family protein [Natronorubrum halophilum]|uniref:aldehyde dehydrogenase family protein n=1 Tax=Natronorubrum halophilum TaxID=1702106 RepID=UPI0010C15AFE|nr:aldehyde dehydrogenase family protein [Natronorubrum halophilum]
MSNKAPAAVSDQYDLWIGGGERSAKNDNWLAVVNPATEEPLADVAMGTTGDINAAVQNAREAFESWQRCPPKERTQTLTDIAAAIREENERLARIETLENGKPLAEAREQVERSARHFEYYAGIADKIQGKSIPLSEEYVDYTVREPLGVTAHIVPWNVPIYLFARSVAPALAAGNAAVVKPAEETPLGALELARLASEAGLPDGLLNVVPGYGNEAGAAITGHPDVKGITFTGSGPTGMAVAKGAIENVTETHLELGGKSPNVVFPDTDWESALDGTMTAIFTNAGQVCSAGSRLLVREDIHEEFVDDLVERAESLEIGPGLKDADMGPLVSETHFEKVLNYVEIGREEVGEPVAGGSALDRDGYFIEPTIFDDVPMDTRIAQEEIFGPVLTVTPFADENEAIELANATDYGLVAGVYTENVGRAHRFAREVDAGQIYINEYFAGGNETPFGGFKDSGIGRENGVQAIDNYTQVKNVCANIGRR